MHAPQHNRAMSKTDSTHTKHRPRTNEEVRCTRQARHDASSITRSTKPKAAVRAVVIDLEASAAWCCVTRLCACRNSRPSSLGMELPVHTSGVLGPRTGAREVRVYPRSCAATRGVSAPQAPRTARIDKTSVVWRWLVTVCAYVWGGGA